MVKKIYKVMGSRYRYVKFAIQSFRAENVSRKYNAAEEVSYQNSYVQYELKDRHLVDLVVVAFNNARIIRYQYGLMKELFQDPYAYTVFDNSTNQTESDKIKDFCESEKIPYLKLNKVMQKHIGPSENHAIALNYSYQNYIKVRNAKYFGFLDHDLFPVKPYSVIAHLEKEPFWGYMKQEKLRYLWPGFSFFCTDYLQNLRVDFMTDWKNGGDTGSRNYFSVYKKYLKNNPDLKFGSFERIQLIRDNQIPADDYESMCSILDGAWVHMINGGNWTDYKNFELKQETFFAMVETIKNSNLSI